MGYTSHVDLVRLYMTWYWGRGVYLFFYFNTVAKNSKNLFSTLLAGQEPLFSLQNLSTPSDLPGFTKVIMASKKRDTHAYIHTCNTLKRGAVST